MKNNILNIILFIGIGLFAASCDSFLEEAPQNKLKPTTTDDFEQLLNKGYITTQVMPYLDILSDDVALKESDHVMPGPDYGDAQVSAYMWDTHHETSMNGGDLAFRKFYESIFYANIVLESIDNATGVELNAVNVERTRKNIRGEAYALRAYSYFHLVNLYAAPYDPKNAETQPGVPYTESTSAEDKAYPRNSVKEIYDAMVSDLTEAIRLMDEYPIEDKSKFKFNSLSAKAFLARVYLYMHDWDNAIKYAKEVITENPSIFNLFEAGEKLNIDNNSGPYWSESVIWGKDYLHKDNDNIMFVNGLNEVIPTLSYWIPLTTFSVNEDLANQYAENDVRRFYFMQTYSQNTYAGPRTKLSYAKNRHITTLYVFGARAASGYTRVLRTEEMYLILAEAYAHKSDGMTTSIDYLNKLRLQKFREGKYKELSSADFNAQTLLETIYAERRRELCFEGHRWFDLRRTTRPAMQRVGYEGKVAKLEKDDPRYILQIPQKELSINPEIGATPR